MAKSSFETSVGSPNYKVIGGVRLKRWIIGLLLFLLASLLAINSFTISQFHLMPLGTSPTAGNYILELKSQTTPRAAAAVRDGYVVYTQGCRIPDLSPYEASNARYFDQPQPIVCEHGSQPPLVESNNSAVYVNLEAKQFYYNDTESPECCWRRFWRKDNKDDEVSISDDCYYFQDSSFVDAEFVRVECQRRNATIYRDYFAFVPRKLHVEERCRKRLRDSARAGSPRKLSVLVVGIDSVSRLNFHRAMPRTAEKLLELGALEMLGYHKVADNTYPNLVPVLSGLEQREFERLCWKNHKRPFDRCPLIWKNFQAAGYRTFFAEDACYMTTFNYLKPGFRIQPTDYYLRPFCVAAEAEIGNTRKLNANLCLGTRMNYDYLLHYTRKVAEEFASDPFFGLFWESSLTHDFIDFPRLGDDSYRDFFAYLKDNDLLRDTAVVFMSDHGMRWGHFRQTYQGRLEDSLPFVFFLMPEWWKEEYPEAWQELNRNARSLTTPFDLHETIRDMMDLSRLKSKQQQQSSNEVNIPSSPSPSKSSKVPRGISMFGHIPSTRSCESAGIPEHWCMCRIRNSVNTNDTRVVATAEFLVSELNRMLEPHSPKCAKLQLANVVDAKAVSEQQPTSSSSSSSSESSSTTTTTTPAPVSAPWTDYSVTFETSPGGAVFEASVRYHIETGHVDLVDTISRLNAYGNQSSCIDDFHMRLYCYCT
ncbi:uncharacterized protein LOC106650121 isoform X2 [Trichogramma pretiosum]|uniref:uncharacterized protein LOC106650121 isoform X2 n=1 Tax=Trichogramma pretiosum TaxID=7493 RepID=UPI0006C99B89|nr:uncharacterized protein LOC106650121 isoform X2 [Trichogramma pretiosum]